MGHVPYGTIIVWHVPDRTIVVASPNCFLTAAIMVIVTQKYNNSGGIPGENVGKKNLRKWNFFLQ